MSDTVLKIFITLALSISNDVFGVLLRRPHRRAEVQVPCEPSHGERLSEVLGCDYCSYWTDPQTMDRPFFYLLPNAARMFNAVSALPKGGAE